jgi:hypothetical protein
MPEMKGFVKHPTALEFQMTMAKSAKLAHVTGPAEFSSSEMTDMRAKLFEVNGAISNFQTFLEIHEDDQANLQDNAWVFMITQNAM